MKIVAIAVALVALAACGTTTTQIPTYQASTTAYAAPVGDPLRVNLSDIGKDYHGNKIAAESKWGGKYVEFTGTVLNISDGWSPSVSFSLPPDLFSQIVCEVEDEQQLNRPNLVSGGRATVRGTIEGDQTMGVVRMNGCVVVG